jgi:hypothetical protein
MDTRWFVSREFLFLLEICCRDPLKFYISEQKTNIYFRSGVGEQVSQFARSHKSRTVGEQVNR